MYNPSSDLWGALFPFSHHENRIKSKVTGQRFEFGSVPNCFVALGILHYTSWTSASLLQDFKQGFGDNDNHRLLLKWDDIYNMYHPSKSEIHCKQQPSARPHCAPACCRMGSQTIAPLNCLFCGLSVLHVKIHPCPQYRLQALTMIRENHIPTLDNNTICCSVEGHTHTHTHSIDSVLENSLAFTCPNPNPLTITRTITLTVFLQLEEALIPST